jgi:hypothetical protein
MPVSRLDEPQSCSDGEGAAKYEGRPSSLATVAVFSYMFGNGVLADIDPEFEQFAMNSWRSP